MRWVLGLIFILTGFGAGAQSLDEAVLSTAQVQTIAFTTKIKSKKIEEARIKKMIEGLLGPEDVQTTELSSEAPADPAKTTN